MNNDIKPPKNPDKGRTMAGIILLGIGAVLLLQQFRFFFIPDSVTLWPAWLIAWGLYIGAKHNFKTPSGGMLVLLGIAMLIVFNVDNSDRIVWPVAIIAFGIWLIIKRGKHTGAHADPEFWEKHYKNEWWNKKDPAQFDATEPVDYTVKEDTGEVPPADPFTKQQQQYSKYTGDDYIDAVSIFGGVNKTIFSKKFRGGEIVNIFGGAELDFTQADINGRVIIDITQIFGGTKIIVPSNWQVVSDLAAVFAGVDDKRIRTTAAPNNDKILVLTGVSIFAGVDIRSY